jgi:predicted PurR-regulated permease PerM
MTGGRQAIWWLAGVVLLVLAIGLLKGVLLPFVAGMAMAYVLNPLANRLEGLGLPRPAAAGLIVALMAVLIGLLLVLLVPLVAAELRDLAANMPQLMTSLRDGVEATARRWLGRDLPGLKEHLEQGFGELSKNWTSALTTILASLWSQGLALVSLLSLILITPVVTYYLLADWPRILKRVDSWLPRDHAATVRRLVAEINEVLAGFVHGQGTVCLVLAAVYGLGLSWAGIKSGLLIGLATGILSFVPFVGVTVGLLIASVLAIVQFWPNWLPLVKVLAVFAAGQILEAAFLSPKIVAGHIKLHPVWLIFALFVFGYLFGLTGMLVAVPTAAAIGVLARFAVEEYLKSPLYWGSGGKTGSEPPDDGAGGGSGGRP